MRNLSKTLLAVLATGLLTCGLFCQQAHSNTISFIGTASASGVSGPNTVTTVLFINPGWTVVTGTGVYAGIPAGTAAIFNNFTFTGTGTGAVLVATVPNQWSTTDNLGNVYSFDLLSLTSGTTTAGSVSFQGIGVARLNGVDAPSSLVHWTLVGTGSNLTFNLSSTTTAPDGGSSFALLGIALAGIEVVRRKIKAKAA